MNYLRILVVANIFRNLCSPYATMIAATGKLKEATAAPVAEAVVNLVCSVYLARRYGAIGVAMGTLIGSFVTLSMHFIVSMRFTRHALAVSPARLFTKGIIQPAVVALPSALLLLPWHPADYQFNPLLVVVWGISTLAIAWRWNLTPTEREQLVTMAKSRLKQLAVPG